jgi:hypothetical protein
MRRPGPGRWPVRVPFYREIRCKFPEPDRLIGVDGGLAGDQGQRAEGNRTMWLSLFTFALGAAVCLSIAAVMMQSADPRRLRG